MNAGFSHTIDSLFGPPSELVDISLFLKSSSLLEETSDNAEFFDAELIDECRYVYKITQKSMFTDIFLSQYIRDIRVLE